MTTTHKTPGHLGTTGVMTADIQNPQAAPPGHSYKGDPDKMLMLQVGGQLRMHSTQATGSTPNENLGFDFSLPLASVPADGVKRQFKFPQEVSATYWAYENGGTQPYLASSGSVWLTLDSSEHVIGTFDFTGAAGTKTVTVTNGDIRLQGFTTSQSIRQNAPAKGSGTFDGTFVGGPAAPQFSADEVSIRRFDLGTIPVYYDVQGRKPGTFPDEAMFVSVLVDEGTTAQTFDLATSREVRVSFFDNNNNYGFAYARTGTVTFTSKPDTGRAAGTLDCTFQKNDGPLFTFRGVFDVIA
jgi:hypothetical protein